MSWRYTPYLQNDPLFPVVQDAEGVEMIRAWLWDNITTCQAQGLLSQFAPVLVLVEMEVTIFYLAPTGLPLAVH